MQVNIYNFDPNDSDNTGRTTQQDGLNIFVSLQATPRKRTTKTKGDNKSVEFVKGTLVDGRNSLTTNYVNVGYDFSDNPELETLNIKTISIDFNSSYVPLVSITFIDIRGDSLMAKGKSSRYANVFFDLPYPIFNLTIKGIYGKAVNYCLHLSKFNSKFNSATGNFEIFCDFIGYTYAFFSDILLGYLKAIGEFPEVKEQLRKEGLISINDFRIQNELLNSKIEKLNKTNPNYIAIGKINKTLIDINKFNDLLLNYKNNVVVNLIGNSIVGDINKSFIVLSETADNYYNLINFFKNIEPTFISINSKLTTKIDFNFSKPKDSTYIKKQNDTNNLVFTKNDIKIYRNVVFNDYSEAENEIDKNIFTEIKNVLPINNQNGAKYIVVSLYGYIKQIKLIIENLNKLKSEKEDELSDDIESITKETFDGFDSTMYNVFHMFTRHIELFMQELVKVGEDAEIVHNKPNSSLSNIKDNLDKNVNSNFIPAFSMYYENTTSKYKDEKVEKWLGTVDSMLPEVVFIEKLIDSLVNGNVSFKQTLTELYGDDGDSAVNYFPTHAKDINGNPYNIIGKEESIENIKKIITNRMLFNLYTNGYLTNVDIITLAKVEAYNCYLNIINTDVLTALINTDKYEIIKTDINDSNFGTIKDLPYNYLDSQDNVFNFSEVRDIDDMFLTESQFQDLILLPPSYSSEIDGVNDSNLVNIRLDLNTTESLLFSQFTFRLGLLVASSIVDSSEPNKSKILNNNSPLFNPMTRNINIDGDDYTFDNVFYGKINNLYKAEIYKITGIRPHEYSGIRFTTSEVVNKVFGSNQYNINLTINNVSQPNVLTTTVGAPGQQVKLFSFDFFIDSSNDIGDRLDNINNIVISDFHIRFKEVRFKEVNTYLSLFGSDFYYKQSDDIRAMLFLSASPILENINLLGILLGNTSNIIKLPTILRVVIGCYLYRLENNLDFATGSGETLSELFSNGNVVLPKKNELYTSLLTKVTRYDSTDDFYIKIPDFIINLPKNIKNNFIERYEQWRDSNTFGGWKSIKGNLEIFNKQNDVITNKSSFMDYYKFNTKFNNNLSNQNYSSIVPMIRKKKTSNIKSSSITLNTEQSNTFFGVVDKLKTYNYALVLKTDKDNAIIKNLNNEISTLFFNDFEYYINYNPYVWNKNLKGLISRNVRSKDTYIDTFYSTLQELDKSNRETQFRQERKEQAFRELFNSENRDEIKLNVYRNIKSIYDKWIGDGNLPYQTCLGLAKNERLIDSFKFIDKFHRPIGDKIFINPKALSNRINESINVSFISLASSLLSDMKFVFIPLPSFLEYKDVNEVKTLFNPYEFYDLVDDTNTIVKPSFICMYINNASNRLDLDENSNYKKDGKLFDLYDNQYVDDDNNSTENAIIPSFIVNYGSENQAIFKDIELNQNEFTTTDETLVIIDNLSNRDAVNESVFLGQNLFDIYSKRSYTAKISLLGNATLMPMHYFQLNNIPLFSGAYIITRVSHSIQNNTMMTNITGVRISINDVPIIRDNKLFLALTDNTDEIIVDSGGQIEFPNDSIGFNEDNFIDE